MSSLKDVVELKISTKSRYEGFSFSVLGTAAKGVTEHFGIINTVDILCGALCSSLGSVGGFCVGNEDEVVNHQRLQGAGYVFSGLAPPFVARAATVAIEKLAENPALTQTLRENALELWAGIEECGHLIVTSAPESPVLHLRAHPDLVPSSFTPEQEGTLLEKISRRLMNNFGIFAVASKYMPHHLHMETAKHQVFGSCQAKWFH